MFKMLRSFGPHELFTTQAVKHVINYHYDTVGFIGNSIIVVNTIFLGTSWYCDEYIQSMVVEMLLFWLLI